MPSFIEKCTKKQVYKFFEEFGGTEESVKMDIEYVKEWLKQQPHLPNADDEEMLTNLLLRSKNSVEKMKRILESYYTVRARMSELLEDRDLSGKELEETFVHGPWTQLPKMTPEGYRIFVFRQLESSGDFVPNGEAHLRFTQICVDVALTYFPCRGNIIIIDFKTLSASYAAILFSILNKLMLLTSILFQSGRYIKRRYSWSVHQTVKTNEI